MNAVVRPIHLPGAAALDVLRRRAQATLSAWAQEWVSGWANDSQAAVHVRTVADEEAQSGHEYSAVRTEAGCMWFRCGPANRLSFGRAVVGAELMPRSACADDWIAGVVDCAMEARDRALCSALLGTPLSEPLPPAPGVLPKCVRAFGAGAVQFLCDELALDAIVDRAVWRNVPPTQREDAHRLPKVTPLERATQRAKVRLEVILGSVAVELPTLLDLRRGDVLRLPQRLDQGIAVLCEGKPLARAALGETQGRKAVQILAEPPALPRTNSPEGQ